MLLENELDEITHWFETQYPGGIISAHAGYHKKDGTEEYHIVFQLEGKHFNADPLILPPAIYNAPKEDIEQFKKNFVLVQKRKIAAAALGLVYH